MSYFKPVDSRPNFPSLEKEILQWWDENGIPDKYLHKNDHSDRRFSFIDGPITANAPMGVHHARGRTLKDVFQRYKNAQGFKQRFQNGFDCQGLWVEVEVEKDIGFNSKKDIANYGLDKFTQSCLARVDKYAALQTQQSIRLGMFMDWDNSYFTNSPTNNLYIWHFLKVIHQKGWLYKSKSAATWCPRCETGLSQHEQADGYRDVEDTSVYLKFKLRDSDNDYVLAWTTTPWTLSANVYLAINPKFNYVKAHIEGQNLILAQQAADRLGLKDYEPIDIRDYLGKEYETVYHIPAQEGIKHTIVEWDLVDPVEGTGVVHVAPGCGQEDYDLGISLNGPMIAPLDATGHFVDGFGPLSGKYAHDVASEVFDHLKKVNAFFKTEKVTHRYPHCWRCHTKCLFRLEDNWFIDTKKIKPELKKKAQEANWIPKYVGRRMQDWLNNMGDWMISRQRFYGLALPFYECTECNELTVIGSLKELKNLAINPELVEGLPSLHRPWIDKIVIKCPHCQQKVRRIPDVGDCWLDAGVVPFSTLKYLEDRQYWKQWFPAEFVCEMIEQVRLWFYSLLFFSVALEERVPYLNVLNYSEVRDEKGERMSKTKKNGIPYDQAVDHMGADTMRWLYCLQRSHMTVNFGFNVGQQVQREFFMLFWNTYRYLIGHATQENWQPQDKLPASSDLTDKWILSRLNSTVRAVTGYLDRYHTAPATEAIQQFVNDLSTWYIRRNRNRHIAPILYTCLETLSLITAPFAPFFAEKIYQGLHPGKRESVHLKNWPQFDPSLIDTRLEQTMDLVRQVGSLVHAARQKAGIKIRQPLASATITTKRPSLNSEALDVIKQETNVKEIRWQKSDSDTIKVELDTNITPELKEEGEYRDFIRQVQIMRKEAGLDLSDQIRIFAPHWPVKFDQEIKDKTLAVSIEKAPEFKIEKAAK